MNQEIFCNRNLNITLLSRLGIGKLFVEMDYTAMSERIEKSIEKGNKEIEKLENEKAELMKEYNVITRILLHFYSTLIYRI